MIQHWPCWTGSAGKGEGISIEVNAVIYGRYSSDNQRTESLDAQIRGCRDFATRNGMTVVGTYLDSAKSATSDKRPEFQRMITDSAKGLFDVAIVHKLDRFARDRYDSARYRHKLKKNGVRLASVLEHLDDSPESVILESMLEGMAEYFSKNLAREVMKGMTENALKCQHTGGIPPLGYDVDPKTKRYLVNEREAGTVRLIFDLYLAGYGYGTMINELNAQGHRTKAGNPFGKNSLHDLLVNEKYSGVYTFNRSASKNADGQRNNHQAKGDDSVIRVPGGVPAIVDDDTFLRVQEKMAANRHQPGRYKAKEAYLLSGLITCGECLQREGREYAYMGNTKHSGRSKLKHITYRCSARARTKVCTNKEISRDAVEGFVLAELEKNIFGEKAIPNLVKRLNDYQRQRCGRNADQIQAISLQAAQVGKEIGNIVEAVAKGFAQASMAAKLAELEAEKANLEYRVAALRDTGQHKEVTEDELRGLFGMFRQYIRDRDVPEIRKFIGSYIEKVVVYQDHCEVVFFFCVGAEKSESLRLTARISRDQMAKRWAA